MKSLILPVKELPKAPSVKKLIGPSFILLGLGLGSGEIILWPYLTSRFGLGIIWGALIGITLQFVMNMEIERYALAKGESVFSGWYRKNKFIPFWFILSTFVPWIWPGIIATSGKIFVEITGVSNTNFVTTVMLVIIGLILSFGPVLYKTVEQFQKILIGVGVPAIFILAIILANKAGWTALGMGIIGRGEGYNFLPIGIPLASFLAAFAYSGAGGNLNLAQSMYIKEKGYGMGKYAGRITSLLAGKPEKVNLEGARFEVNNENTTEFKKWWKNINIEHFTVFWITGTVTILLLALLSYTTTYGKNINATDINFLFAEAHAISNVFIPFAGVFFLIIAMSTLFGTQLTVFDATSRILAENLVYVKDVFVKKDVEKKLTGKALPKIYYTVLWAQIIAGIIIMNTGFNQPLQLVTIAAVMNAFAMFTHSGLTLWLNMTELEAPIRPNLGRRMALGTAFTLYGAFCGYIVLNALKLV